MKIDKLNLKSCPYCGGKPEYKRRKEKHTFLKGSNSKINVALNDFLSDVQNAAQEHRLTWKLIMS